MKILNQIQDIFYDIFGFIIPGLFTVLLLIPFFVHQKSFAYCFFTYGPRTTSIEILSFATSYKTTVIIAIVCFAAYLLGHLINVLPSIAKLVLTKLSILRKNQKKKRQVSYIFFSKWIHNDICKRYQYITNLEKQVEKKLESDNDFNLCTYLKQSPDSIALIKTYASSNSRFQNAVSNISKYNNKVHFFKNLKTIMWILLADFIITLAVYTTLDFIYLIGSITLIYPSRSSDNMIYLFVSVTEIIHLWAIPFLKKCIYLVLLYFFYLTFLYEQLHHEQLHKKELFLYVNYLLEKKNKS